MEKIKKESDCKNQSRVNDKYRKVYMNKIKRWLLHAKVRRKKIKTAKPPEFYLEKLLRDLVENKYFIKASSFLPHLKAPISNR